MKIVFKSLKQHSIISFPISKHLKQGVDIRTVDTVNLYG